MRVIEIYEAGGFPQLVLASKQEFARRYALSSDYWQRVPIEEAPEVVAHLKANLRDLANHFHAAYQDPEATEEADVSYAEAQHWYRAPSSPRSRRTRKRRGCTSSSPTCCSSTATSRPPRANYEHTRLRVR